jgi:hypothetical protein
MDYPRPGQGPEPPGHKYCDKCNKWKPDTVFRALKGNRATKRCLTCRQTAQATDTARREAERVESEAPIPNSTAASSAAPGSTGSVIVVEDLDSLPEAVRRLYSSTLTHY